MAKKQNIRFVLKKLKTEQFSIFPENLSGSAADAKMELQVGFKADKDKRMVGAFNLITFEKDTKPLIRLEVSCHFRISKLSFDKLVAGKNGFTLPGEFLSHLAAVTFGASRGVLHARTEGTAFSTFLLPLVNFNEFVGKDAKVLLSET